MIDRRKFLRAATAIGASAVFCTGIPLRAQSVRAERRDLYPEGVASGDPDPNSVLLWTRRPFGANHVRATLTVEVAEDDKFEHVIASRPVTILASADWTCRVLIGGLKPASQYWYRFVDTTGFASRMGRTMTSPDEQDTRTTRFAFVSCQNVNTGAQNAWRRMIWEDERAALDEQLDFILQLGDFIYELVWYPEDRPQGMYDRQIRDVIRYPHGQAIEDFHIPTTTEDYRCAYRAYLHDRDVQDARARWPFVNMWDNHEYSWLGWQGLQKFGEHSFPAQTRKVAANQAWFEYQPARVKRPVMDLQSFNPPAVFDAPINHFDDHGWGQEINNSRAVGSLTGYRALRWGAHVDLLITDQHSYRSEEPTDRPEAKVFSSKAFPEFIPMEVQQILDAGRAWNNNAPPESIRYGATEVPNFRKAEPPQTILGAAQKAWFLKRLKESASTWKIWANTAATMEMRADPKNLPEGLASPWPGAGYAGFRGADPSTAYAERAEVFDWVATQKIEGFAIIAGDRHSFWAGLAAKSLPPLPFEPVGISFVTGSLSAPGMCEALEHGFPKDHPLRPLFLADRSNGVTEFSVNLMLKYGVRCALEYARSGDREKAMALGNPDNAPHVKFVDMAGHGYSVVRAAADTLEVEFVCIERPVVRSKTADGGPIRYRTVSRTHRWKWGGAPQMTMQVKEGDTGTSW